LLCHFFDSVVCACGFDDGWELSYGYIGVYVRDVERGQSDVFVDGDNFEVIKNLRKDTAAPSSTQLNK
jgi:hypothetical protein